MLATLPIDAIAISCCSVLGLETPFSGVTTISDGFASV
jgi:hypothetical protein